MNYSDSSMVQTVKVNMVVNMKYSDFVRYYVKEFKTLEDEFLETDQYVSIDKKNFNTFSHKYRSLFSDSCSGLDSLAEDFCVEHDEMNCIKNKRQCMLQRYAQLKELWPNLPNEPVVLSLYGDKITVVPFGKFSDLQCSDWWREHNEVKHRRTCEVESTNGNMCNFELANLKNVVYSLAAYYLLLCLVCEHFYGCDNFEFPLKSKLFSFRGNLYT